MALACKSKKMLVFCATRKLLPREGLIPNLDYNILLFTECIGSKLCIYLCNIVNFLVSSPIPALSTYCKEHTKVDIDLTEKT